MGLEVGIGQGLGVGNGLCPGLVSGLDPNSILGLICVWFQVWVPFWVWFGSACLSGSGSRSRPGSYSNSLGVDVIVDLCFGHRFGISYFYVFLQ